jgi:hypothetical protein
MADTPAASVSRRNYWPLVSLWLGVLGFALALTAPIPFVPIISAFTWPLGLAAMAAGWAGGRAARVSDDVTAAGRARWGIRLGCMGWIIQAATSTIKMLIIAGVLAYALSAYAGNLFTPQPTGTP